jgi:hypothetical protein
MRGKGTLSRFALLLEGFLRNGRLATFALYFVFGPAYMLLTRLSLSLDEAVHPDLVDLPVEKPVFIMGHPRSGTSFFQRRIFRSDTAAMFTTWELFFPSVILRRVLRPVIRFLSRNDVDVMQSADYGHEVRLADVEEDEGLFLHRLDTEMMTFLCPRLLTDERVGKTAFRLGWLDHAETRRSVEFYRRCLTRNLYHTGKRRVVAKCNPSVFRLPELLEVFPDARIVYVVRSPEESVRSFLAFTKRFVARVLSPREQRVYYRRKYAWGIELYRQFEQHRKLIPPEQLLVLTFDEITRRPEEALRRFFDFADIPANEESIRNVSERRRSRGGKNHVNESLYAFGLTPEQVREDLGFVRRRYLGSGDEGPAESNLALGGVGS